MRNFLSVITDRLLKTTYQNTQSLSHINIKDDTLIINLLSKFILPILMIFGFYVHVYGDYTPGGGFQSGVIFACDLCLYYFINIEAGRKRLSHYTLTCFAMVGFLLYTGIGILSFFITGHFLDFTFLPFSHTNARGIFIVECGISFVVFSSVARTFTTLFDLIKEELNKEKDKQNINNNSSTMNDNMSCINISDINELN